MSAAFSDQACHSECTDADAMQTPAKRARIEVKTFKDLDLSKFTLKNNGKGKNGQNTYPLVADEPIRFNLTPSGWLQTPFGFDISGKYEYPSFLGGPEPDKVGSSEGLSLRLNLQPEQAEFLGKLDATSQKAFADIIQTDWSPLVITDDLRKLVSCKVKVVLKGADMTKLTIVKNSVVSRGEGWDFSNNCSRAEVKLTARVKKLWNMAKRAGLSLEATQIVLRIDKAVEEEAFADDAELLA